LDNETINKLFFKFLSEEELKLFDTLRLPPSHFINERLEQMTGALALKLEYLLAYGAIKTPELTSLAKKVCRYSLIPKKNGYMLVRKQKVQH
jgi:hypothetical protein